MSWFTIGAVGHGLLVVIIGLRVIMRRPEPGVALAWLFLVVLFPLIGALVYRLFGERSVDPRREREILALQQNYRQVFGPGQSHNADHVDWRHCNPAARQLDMLGDTVGGSHSVGGNAVTLYSDSDSVLQAMVDDIDAANKSVLIETFIWAKGGLADAVLDAVIRAAGRGLPCRLLVDTVGGRPWLRSGEPARLRAAGVELKAVLPVGLIRSFFGRSDIRLHRKITVVDGAIAWTGSMNMVDPHYFKQDAGVGEWVDAMVRLEGPVVAALAAVAIGDWRLETGEAISDLAKSAGLHVLPSRGATVIQVVPSGPLSSDGLLQMLLALIGAARDEVVITTPYLVPDISLLRALRGAAGRGVAVSIIVPERVDSVLTRYASRSYFDDLLEAGVAIHLYREGLLHTKSVTVDGSMAMFGTANVDMRSLWLNYEVVLFVYDADFSKELRALQDTYLRGSDRLKAADRAGRPFARRFIENTARLISPLL